MANLQESGHQRLALKEDKEAILGGIGRVVGIIDGDGGEVTDFEKTTKIGELLRECSLDPAVALCFRGDDGQWDSVLGRFQAVKVWKTVRAALVVLATTVLAENRTVHYTEITLSVPEKDSTKDDAADAADQEDDVPVAMLPRASRKRAKPDDGKTASTLFASATDGGGAGGEVGGGGQGDAAFLVPSQRTRTRGRPRKVSGGPASPATKP
jgi:hypothetical protein